MKRLFLGLLLLSATSGAVAQQVVGGTRMEGKQEQQVVLAGGCFWCVEAVYQAFQGVQKVESGYAGGTVANPTYEAVSTGQTGHAEAVRVTFDPGVIALDDLLRVFFHAHNPTTLNRQGADVGTQYRSAIFYSDEEQRLAAEKIRAEIAAERVWPEPIVTEIAPLTVFYSGEDYHQNYYARNPSQPYCSLVIAPKLQKIYKLYAAKLKRQEG